MAERGSSKARRKPICRVSPVVPSGEFGSDFGDMDDGDCFIWEEAIWMKCDTGNQNAIRLEDGDMTSAMCDNSGLVPVDIQVTWEKK